MKFVTSETMRAIDSECIDKLGIPGLKLMENAGVGTVRFIERELGPQKDRTVTVVCGKGNNGGDGFVIARELRRSGASVSVYLVGHRDDVSGDARTNLGRLGLENVVELSDGRSIAGFVEVMTKSDFIVDAVFGTGFNGVPRGLSGTVIGQMNACGRPVLAVDVPSGLNATTGIAEGECVNAAWTCTMGLSKRGFYMDHGRACVGKLHVVDIGVPRKAIEQVGVRENVLTMRDAAELLPPRPFDGHKGTFGTVVVVAGSVGYTGAAALTALSALRTGAGLVYLGVPSSLNDIMETKLTEVITRPLAETAARSLSPESLLDIRELLENAEALALGPGISRDQETQSLVRSIVAEMRVPCVIDADGLNALTPEEVGQRTGEAPVVLTPHPGEMARLAGCSIGGVLADREGVARATAVKARATVVLKGVGSVVAAPSGELYMNPTGNSGLASGGTGDVLTGIIAGFLGQGVAATEAAALGAFVHGLAGDLAAEALGEAGMIAGDVLDHVPYALMELGGEAGV
jgi:NAD(P)H-hydrate epimerase